MTQFFCVYTKKTRHCEPPQWHGILKTWIIVGGLLRYFATRIDSVILCLILKISRLYEPLQWRGNLIILIEHDQHGSMAIKKAASSGLFFA
jgi:hypothetical protein